MAELFLSTGVPMINGGDEFGRSQQGNNNPYCQDNEISWYSWELEQWQEDLLETVRHLVALRREHPCRCGNVSSSPAARFTPTARPTSRGTAATATRWADELGRSRCRRAPGPVQRRVAGSPLGPAPGQRECLGSGGHAAQRTRRSGIRPAVGQRAGAPDSPGTQRACGHGRDDVAVVNAPVERPRPHVEARAGVLSPQPVHPLGSGVASQAELRGRRERGVPRHDPDVVAERPGARQGPLPGELVGPVVSSPRRGRAAPRRSRAGRRRRTPPCTSWTSMSSGDRPPRST